MAASAESSLVLRNDEGRVVWTDPFLPNESYCFLILMPYLPAPPPACWGRQTAPRSPLDSAGDGLSFLKSPGPLDGLARAVRGKNGSP